MFTRIVTSALFAGFAAGLIAASLQFVFVQPVLLHAELYEGGDLVHFGAGASGGGAHVDLPGFDPMRDGLSILFNALIYVGYAFILVAAMAFAEDRGANITPRAGILWGIAGFLAVQFAPAVGLPPELPGSAAADVGARQIWWFGTVATAIVGLWLIAFGKSLPAWGGGVILLALPHIIGAPHPDSFSGPVPPELAGLFASRALALGLLVWVCLGMLAAHFWHSENR